MIKVFETLNDFESYVSGGLIAGELYWVEEDKSVHFRTNNIDGTDKVYNIGVGDDLVPEGNIAITENSEEIDVAEYATASVNVPIPAGYIVPTGSKSITANGESIDVAEYATANVNVPIPAGYIQPSGTKSISANGTSIDVAAYATVDVSVPVGITPTGSLSISVNDTYDITNYASVVVNVPSSGGAPQWETVQADASGNAYVPCAHEDVIYISSTATIFPNMYVDSSKNQVLETYMGAQAPVGPQDETSNLYKAYVLCVIPFDTAYDSDFETVAYAFINTTPNATIRYKKMSL